MRLLRGKSRGPPQIKPLYHRKKKGVDERMAVICMQSDFVFVFESKQIMNWKQSKVEYSRIANIKTAICKLLET